MPFRPNAPTLQLLGTDPAQPAFLIAARGPSSPSLMAPAVALLTAQHPGSEAMPWFQRILTHRLAWRIVRSGCEGDKREATRLARISRRPGRRSGQVRRCEAGGVTGGVTGGYDGGYDGG